MTLSTSRASQLIEQALTDRTLISAVASAPRTPGDQPYKRVIIKPVMLRSKYYHQFAYHAADKVKHVNLELPEALQALNRLTEEFKQVHLFTQEFDAQILVNAKGQTHVHQKPPTKSVSDPSLLLQHNKTKNHILPEGTPCEFLNRLGLMTAEGTVVAAKYDKFRQVNRFLEMVDDVAASLPQGQEIHVVDFGCGKAYLTFALYHYLRELKGLNVQMIGLDLKAEVIENNEQLARALGYSQLRFRVGDIEDFVPEAGRIDMTVSLHACDTATDEALAQAVRWGSSVILASPCCQHELMGQINNAAMIPLTRHGILREKLASLITDAVRAELLEVCHYSVQLLEFIEAQHTPKNVLIRAVRRTTHDQKERAEQYMKFRDFWHIQPRLEVVLSQAGGAAEDLLFGLPLPAAALDSQEQESSS